MEEDSHDDGADGARTRFSGSVEEVADALQMRTPADIKYQDELRVGQTSILVNTVLLSAQGHRLRRLFALWPDLTFKRKTFEGALAVVVQRNPSWAFDHIECLEFKKFVAKRLMVICRHTSSPQALTNPLSWEIDDQAGLDEGEQLASDQLPSQSGQLLSPSGQLPCASDELACASDLPLFGETVEEADVEYMFCSDTRSYGRRAKATKLFEWTTDISPQSQPFDPAVAKWPDGCTVIVPEILSLTCQTRKTEDEEASCTKRRKREPHFQGRTKSGAEVVVKTHTASQT